MKRASLLLAAAAVSLLLLTLVRAQIIPQLQLDEDHLATFESPDGRCVYRVLGGNDPHVLMIEVNDLERCSVRVRVSGRPL